MSVGTGYMALMENRAREEKKKKEEEKRVAYESSSAVGKEYMELLRQRRQEYMTAPPSVSSMEPGARGIFDMSSDPYGRKDWFSAWKKENPDEYRAWEEYRDARMEYQRIKYYDEAKGESKLQALKKAIELEEEMVADQDLLDGWVGAWGNEAIPADVVAEQDIVRGRIENARAQIHKVREDYGIPEGTDLGELLATTQAEHHRSKLAKKELEMSSVVNNPDFVQYSQMGAAMENPSYKDATGWGYLFGWRPGADEVKNKVTFARDNAESLKKEKENRGGNTGIPAVVDPIFRHMNDDEVSIYNYYLAKEGDAKAEEYLKSIEDKLNQREAAEEYARIQGRTGLEVMYGLTVGADQFRSGISSLFDDSDYIAPSAIQYAGQAARQDLEDNGPKILGSSLGQIGYDTLSTTANMAPSILASLAIGTVSKTAGAAVGNALMGASAAGNAYAEKLNLGYSKEQAKTYGVLVGASEIVMERLLGGISAMGGSVLSNSSVKMLSQIDNVLGDVARTAGGKLLLNATSEAIEEGLQSILEPYLWQAVSGEDADVNWQETLYSALLGFATGGMFEAAPAVSTALGNAEAKRTYGPQQETIVGEVLELAPESKYAQSMQAKLGKGKDLSGVQLSHLMEIRDVAVKKQTRTAMQSAFEAELKESGETGDVKVISEALAKKAMGEKLTRAEKKAIAKSEYGQRIAQELEAAAESEGVDDGAPEAVNIDDMEDGVAEATGIDMDTRSAEAHDTDSMSGEEYAGIVQAAEAEVDSKGVSTEESVGFEEEVEVREDEPTATKARRSDATVAAEEDSGVDYFADLFADLFADEDGSASEDASVLEGATLQESQINEADGTFGGEVSDSGVEADSSVSLEEASRKYGAQAKAMVATYDQGQDVGMFDRAYGMAYDMGKSGVGMEYALKSEATSYLTKEQAEHAYKAGRSAAAMERDQIGKGKSKNTGKKSRKKGTVKGEGVSIADLKKTFNDPQGKAYKVLSTIAEATGINIVLFRSEVDGEGRFVGEQGRYEWKDDTIYIDVNAGVSYAEDVGEVSKYAMLRTFAHEFTHFTEKNAPELYDQFRELVFAEMTARGEDVHDLIEMKQELYKDLSYDMASREVVADAMTDILPDSSFVQKLAEENKSLFEKLLDHLRDFVENLKSYFASLGHNPSREAEALKEQVGNTVKYLDSIVEMFDRLAVEAVENYQGRVADADAVYETVSEVDEAVEAEVIGDETEVAEEADIGRIQDTAQGKATEEAELQGAVESASAKEAPLEPVPSAEELAAARERERALQGKRERLAELEGQFNEASSQYGALGKKNKAIDAELRKLYPYAGSETRTDILSIDKDFYEEVLEYRQGTNKRLPAVDMARKLYEYGYNTLSGVPRPLAPALFQLTRFPDRYGAIPSTEHLQSVYRGTRHSPKYMIPLGGEKYISFSTTAGDDGSLSATGNTNPCIVDEKGNPLTQRVANKDLGWDRWISYEDIAGNPEGILGVSKEELLSSPVIKKAISDLKKQREMDSAADHATYDAPNGGRDVLPLLDRYSENVRQMQELKQQGKVLRNEYQTLLAEIEAEEARLEERADRNAEAELVKENRVQYQARRNSKATKNITKENVQLNIDNAANAEYNNSRNGGEENDSSSVVRGVGPGVPGLRGVNSQRTSERNLGRGYQRFPRIHLNSALDKAFKQSGIVAAELYDYSADSAAYSFALDDARNADPKNGWCVTPQAADELYGKDLRMDSKHSIGYVISNGDIEGVFKNKAKNNTRLAFDGVMPQAIADGGNKLDCYGEGLVYTYERYGFIPVARIEFNPEYANSGWDESKGRPYIYMMIHNGDSAETVVSKIGQYDHFSVEQLEALPTYGKDGYDDAAEYRDTLLKRNVKKSVKTKADLAQRDADYMAAVESGNTKAQQRMVAEAAKLSMADSVVVDEKGKLLTMYHGTANGGAFTVFEGDRLSNDSRTSQIGQGFYFTNVKKEAEAYTKNVDIYGRVNKGSAPHLHKVYLNITNPFDVRKDSLDLDKAKAVYMDGGYDYFYNSWIPFYLDKKSVNGKTYTKAELTAMTKEQKVSLYVDYLSQLGVKEVLSNMVRAFGYKSQGALLESMKVRLGYDGIKEEYRPGAFQYVAFSPEQIKSADPVTYDDNGNVIPLSERFNEEKPDIRYSLRTYDESYDDPKQFSYQWFVNKPDMEITEVDQIKTEKVKDIRKDVIDMGIANATAIGTLNEQGNPVVYVKDIKKGVAVSKSGLKHGMDRRADTVATVVTKVGDILSNAVLLNKLKPRTENIADSYILLGAAKNKKNEPYIVSFVVNRYTSEVMDIDIIYSVNAKTEPAGSLSPSITAENAGYFTGSTVTIAELLDYVNKYFPDIMPEDVFRHYGYDRRPDGALGKDVLYQLRTNTLTDHEILEMAADELDGSKLTDGERAALEVFRKRAGKLNQLKDERQKQGRLFYEAQFGENKDAEKAKAARNRMSVLDGQITKASAEVLGLEDKKVLKDVLQKSRKVIEQHERKASLERIRKAREETRAKERKAADERVKALRDAKNRRIEEVKADERLKAQEKIEDLRDKKNAKIEEIKTEAREKAKAKVENRKKTELRGKIQKQLSELNSLLQNGNKKKNVKNGMKDTASALLAYGELLFSEDANVSPETMVRNGIETDLTEKESRMLDKYIDLLEKRDMYEEQLREAAGSTEENRDAKFDGMQSMIDLINKKKLPELTKSLEGVFERERARLNKVTFSAVLKDLTDAYKALEKSKDPFISGAYNQYVYDRLVAMNNPDAGVTTTIKDMSLAQLSELNDAIKMVVTSIKNANTLFRDGQREVLSERAEQVFMEIRKLYRKRGDPTVVKNAVADAIKSFAWNELKPIYAFERIGSEKFTELFWDVINGESEYGLECDKAAGFVGELRNTYGYKDWNFDKVKVFKTADGQDFKLTLGDMMSIFAYSRREQAQKHMFEGGFTFHTGKTETYKDTDGKKRVRLVSEDTYRMTPELLDKILSSLSKDQKAYAEAMQDYLTKLGEMGNKVSRVLYGIDLFKETHYFPLKSDRDYRSTVEAQLNQTQTAASLVNIGMAKETVPEASNPIVLQRFDDVAVRHIDQMLKYSSMVLPIENLRKVLDFAPGEYGTWNAPVKKLISTVHGTAASQYVNQWLTDLNGSSGTDGARNPLSSMFARSKKVAVAGNLSVVVQQYFAVARAMAEIDGKYFISSDGKADGSQWEELKKWAGVAVIKDIGGFDMGSARSATEYIGKAGTKTGVMDTIDKVASYGSAKMDELGWGTIWRAAKAEIADTAKLKVGSEEFFKAAAKRFTEVVVKTQVYDSVTARSGFMRSKSEAVKYLVSFMGEPTTTVNMMLNAQMKLFRAQKYGTKAEAKKAWGKMARTSGAVILSTVLGIIAKSAVYAMRDDDDETESFLERYMKQIGSSFRQELNPLNLLPVARDIMSMVKGRDIERPDMALINSAIKTFKKALKADENHVEAWADVVLSFGNLLGVPLKNVLRDGAGVVRLIGDMTDDISPKDLGKTFFKEGFLGREATKNEILYAAIVTEDAGRLEVLRKGYKSDTDYTNAIRKALRECDDRIHLAAEARYSGDIETYTVLAKEVIAEGHFIQDDVVAAIMTEISAMENEAKGEKESSPKIYSMYTPADYLSSIDQPKLSKEIKDYLIAEYMETGMSTAEAEDEFKSDVKDQIKKWYTDGESEVRISKQEATEMLRKYVGLSPSDVTSTINQWSSKVVTGIAYEDIKDEFLAGNMTASRAIDMRVRYGGETKEEATEKVEEWKFEKEYGFAYGDRKDAYIGGEVSASQLRTAMTTYGGMSAGEADEYIGAYDWMKSNPGYDLSVSDVISYTRPIEGFGKSIEQVGIQPDVYMQYKDLRSKCKGVDANRDGKTYSGSVKSEVLKAIDSLPISRAQKDALYYLNGWSKSTIREAPWH